MCSKMKKKYSQECLDLSADGLEKWKPLFRGLPECNCKVERPNLGLVSLTVSFVVIDRLVNLELSSHLW